MAPRLHYLYRETLNALTLEEQEALPSLTLDGEGNGPGAMAYALRWKSPHVKHIYLASFGKTLVGWGYLYYSWSGEVQVHTYVAPSFRRQGIGAGIVKRLTPLYRDTAIVGYGWNDIARNFYRCFKRVRTA